MSFYREASLLHKMAVCKSKKVLLTPLFSSLLKEANTPKYFSEHNCSRRMSLKKLCELYPLRIKRLFDNLNLQNSSLSPIAILVADGNWYGACKALIDYYRQTTRSYKVPLSLEQEEINSLDVEQILQDCYTFQSATAKLPRFANGLLNWSFRGGHGDREWAWYLNRHYHLRALLQKFKSTGDPIYVRHINAQIIDWVISNPSNSIPNTELSWRGLEASFRTCHWTQIFYELQAVADFSDVARILLLSSILDHAQYLRYFSSWGVNWLIKEMNALATIALYFPEFKLANSWFDYAQTNIVKEFNQQIYPDGVQKELSSHYHRVSLQDFQRFADLTGAAGKLLPPKLKVSLEQMWSYLAYSLRPSGYGVLNNDSDLDYNLPLVKQAATIYQREDWKYIATNGHVGSKPKACPSVFFPWSGQLIMRNNWSKEAHWAFFDMGSWGVYYHSHNDKLHLSISAYGRDILVDGGRYSYIRDKFWHYFRSSASHNVILVDGNGQKNDFSEALEPKVSHEDFHITPEYDFAKGIFDRGFNNIRDKVSHTRRMIYLRNQFWIVLDSLKVERPHQIQPLWHFHPDCTVKIETQSVVSADPGLGNLRIIPVSDLKWDTKLVRGSDNPVQGWWSSNYNVKMPSTTAIYSTQIKSSCTFAWILIPAKGIVPSPNASIISVSPQLVTLKVGIKTISISLEKNCHVEINHH